MPVEMHEGICSEKSFTTLKCIVAVLAFFYGFIGVFICIWKKNYYAMVTSLLLECISVQLLRYNAFYMKNKLQEKTNVFILNGMKIFSIIIFLLLLASGIVDIYLAVKYNQDFHIEEDGYYFAAIPSFLGCNLAAVLYFDCIKFAKIVDVPHTHLQNL